MRRAVAGKKKLWEVDQNSQSAKGTPRRIFLLSG